MTDAPLNVRFRRRWIRVGGRDGAPDRPSDAFPTTTPADDLKVARLLDDAYAASIDADATIDHASQMRTWRAVDHADDEASFIALDDDGNAVGVSLVGRELGAPILYEVAVHPDHRRAGVATRLLAASLAVLTSRGEAHVSAWVTAGHTGSEMLLSRAGFAATTPPLDAAAGRSIYRAAAALGPRLGPDGADYWVEPDPDRPVVWAVGDTAAPAIVDLAADRVAAAWVPGHSGLLTTLARRTTPLTGAGRHALWLEDGRSASSAGVTGAAGAADPLVVRPYEATDEPGWVRCRAVSFLRSAYFDDVVTAKPDYDGRPAISLVAERGNRIVGVIDVVVHENGLATIDTVAVDPEAASAGVGTALLEEAVATLPAGVTVLDAWTRDDPEANGWYAARGFRQTFTYLHVYADDDELPAAGARFDPSLTPIRAWFHASIDDAHRLRSCFRRVHECRRYERPIGSGPARD